MKDKHVLYNFAPSPLAVSPGPDISDCRCNIARVFSIMKLSCLYKFQHSKKQGAPIIRQRVVAKQLSIYSFQKLRAQGTQRVRGQTPTRQLSIQYSDSHLLQMTNQISKRDDFSNNPTRCSCNLVDFSVHKCLITQLFRVLSNNAQCIVGSGVFYQ